MEGYVNLFSNEHEGTNKPHFKGFIKIDGIEHEFALWPNKDGKKGFSGKYKPKQVYNHGLGYSDAAPAAKEPGDDEVPF
jgi:hypothetical protein